jgi:hypothetical protein
MERLARDTSGQPYQAVNFDFDAHDKHVQAGHCPVVSFSRAWCSRPAEHPGQKHRALVNLDPGKLIFVEPGEWEI